MNPSDIIILQEESSSLSSSSSLCYMNMCIGSGLTGTAFAVISP